VSRQDSDLDEIATVIDWDPALRKRLVRVANPDAENELKRRHGDAHDLEDELAGQGKQQEDARSHAARQPRLRMRCSAVSSGVMARNAGTTASGSTITKSELAASRMYSSNLMGAN
jgi:hypothetical protein